MFENPDPFDCYGSPVCSFGGDQKIGNAHLFATLCGNHAHGLFWLIYTCGARKPIVMDKAKLTAIISTVISPACAQRNHSWIVRLRCLTHLRLLRRGRCESLPQSRR